MVDLVKRLPAIQWIKLRAEVDKVVLEKDQPSGLEDFLLSAPTFGDDEIEAITKARQEINQWRAK